MATRKRPDGKTEILDPDTCSGYYTQFRALKGIHTRFVDNGDDICTRCKLGPMWSSDNPDNAYDDASLQGDPLKKGNAKMDASKEIVKSNKCTKDTDNKTSPLKLC